jgi:hypothetical protein
MQDLGFSPVGRNAADPDLRVLSDESVENAKKEGEGRR